MHVQESLELTGLQIPRKKSSYRSERSRKAPATSILAAAQLSSRPPLLTLPRALQLGIRSKSAGGRGRGESHPVYITRDLAQTQETAAPGAGRGKGRWTHLDGHLRLT